jgi:hypothetical protein
LGIIRRYVECFALLAVILVAAIATETGAVAEGQRYCDEVFASATAYGQATDENGQRVTLRLDLYRPSGDTDPCARINTRILTDSV